MRLSGSLREWRAAGLVAGAAVMLWAFSFAGVTAAFGQTANGSERTVSDGVYTEAQAKRGTATYVDKCSECHDSGVMAPELDGGDFLAEWEGKSLGALFRLIQTTMPADAPGDLKEHDVLDLTAYVLQANGFPPGDQSLDNVRGLDAIKFARKN